MAASSYLRYPHVACDLITFTAEDDVWLASLSEAADGRGTQAWRLTADQAAVLHPRLNPSATHVAWTSTRDGSRSLGHGTAREAYAVPAEGGPVSRLTYWGDRFATVRGWVSDNEVLVLSRTGQHSSMKTWAFVVPLSGPARRLDYGPTGDVAVRGNAVLVGSAMNFEPAEPAQWKRYRGGAGGKIWHSPDGSHYTRIFADVGSNLVNPMFVGPRVVFLSDHEGTGAWSTSGPGRSGCSSRSTPSRCAWTYGSAESAPGGPPIRCPRSRSSARSRLIPPAGCLPPRSAVPCTGCPAGTGRAGLCSPSQACAAGFQWSSPHGRGCLRIG